MIALKTSLMSGVKEKLARGEVVYSMTACLVKTFDIASIAYTAGFDSLYIYMESSSFSLEAAGQLCMACIGLGVTPFVRIPSPDPHFIARMLDSGALGIFVPRVQSAEDARAIVRAARHVQFHYRLPPAADATPQLDEATMIIAMIESLEGLDAVEEIAAVEGVDILLVDGNELSIALGVSDEMDHDLVRNAYRRVLHACLANSKVLGIGGLGSRPDLIKELLALGARYVSTGNDISFLLDAAVRKRQQFT
ncbi:MULTISPECIES: HpcH/HpaI aldolase family protein [unclassified Pseudomonas]|uniref:HpcH/HpaI aldolase family protein n=1 Tax=unclassified Pseudomonas TaxID=196821 RepID=UPI0030DD50B7